MRQGWMWAAGLAALTLGGGASAQSFGTNLIVNGDAEAGAKGSGNVVAVPGFTTTGQFTVVSYATGGGYPNTGDVGGASVGEGFFTGGSVALSTGFQSIDLAALAPVIDFGTSSFALSALLGGFASQGDNAILSITFRGLGQAVLGTSAIGPVTTADRGNDTQLLPRSSTGLVPIGARSVDVLLTMTRTAGSANDGYADNLSLVLTRGAAAAVPEPAGWAMMIGGIGVLGGTLRRRRTAVRVRFA